MSYTTNNPDKIALCCIVIMGALMIFLFPFMYPCSRANGNTINLPSHKVTVNNHACKWAQCPYHGINPTQYRYIVEYVGSYGTDAYYIDSLHLEYPAAEYEELETKLQAIK